MQETEPAIMFAAEIAIGVFAFGTRKRWLPVFVNGANEIIDDIQRGFEWYKGVLIDVWHGGLLERSWDKSYVSDTSDRDPRERAPATEPAQRQYVEGEIDEHELEERLEEALNSG